MTAVVCGVVVVFSHQARNAKYGAESLVTIFVGNSAPPNTTKRELH